ncbi:MAG: hypothetical protein Q9160_005789 [Pyrenula sp. 1 TL-2023]
MSLLTTTYPWTSLPLICNAPMGGYSGPFARSPLAVAVTQAGGIGFIGTVADIKGETAQELTKARDLLSASGHYPPNQTDNDNDNDNDNADAVLPIGVGFLPCLAALEDCIEVVRAHRPAVVWFFAARELGDYAVWTRAMREVSPKSRVWVQVGSVAAAVEVAGACEPDVLVVQGIDAGGHAFEKGAGVISLVPEVGDALVERGGKREIALVAAGGIVDGRGVAAACALGASGVVMGTRFLASEEVSLPHRRFRDVVLGTRDGGQNTVRAKVFDELMGVNVWPEVYDGRSVVTESYVDVKSGKGIEDVRALFKEAEKGEEMGFGDGKGKAVGRATVWAGTGVGLVNEVKPAGEIVREAREGARAIFSRQKF